MKSPYEIDQALGLEYFITDTQGIGGKLRTIIDDFCVEELSKDVKEDPDGDYTHFTFEKWNMETTSAIKAVARALGVSHKRFGYAGTKDKRARTCQRVAVWRIEPEKLAGLNINNITISGFKKSSERLSLGDATGNAFKITVRNVEGEDDSLHERISNTCAQLTARGLPNYFGYQRFGVIRPNTHLIGKALIEGDIEEAVMQYIGRPFDSEREDAFEARKFVDETRDFKKALEIFPKRLNFERTLLDALSKNPRDYAGALRRFPKKLRWMFVHAYQSYLFNRILSRMIEDGMNIKGLTIPLFGYETEFSDGLQGEIERSVLKEEDVQLENFKIKAMPELNSKGVMRSPNVEVEPSFRVANDEINKGKSKVVFEFSMVKGSYASVVLREFMKVNPVDY